MQTGIHVGHNEAAAKEIHKAVMDILSAKVDQETMRVALGVISNAFRIDGVSLTNCSIVSGLEANNEVL